MRFLVLLAILCGIGVSAALPDTKVDYSNVQVLSTVARTQSQLNFLRHLSRYIESVELWTPVLRIDTPLKITVDRKDRPKLNRLLKSARLEISDEIASLQQYLNVKEKEIVFKQQNSLKADFDLENFHTYEEIVDFINGLSNSSSLARVSVIGSTHGNRDIKMITLSTGTDPAKAAIYLECGMHAREWISPATCLWIINDLVTQYGTDPVITSLLDNFDWLVTPVSNPDGYVHSWTTDRLWRKNRVPNSGSNCIGVDTNRNFDANFGGVGSSSDPCSQTYGGPSAFSEAESGAMRDVLAANRPRVKACVSIHSNAQMMLSPYGFNSTLPPDYPEMERVMRITTSAIAERYGTQFEYGNGADVLYLTSGTTKDYVYLTEGIVHGYTLEVRNSVDGFVPSVDEIYPTVTETWDGLKAMAVAIMQ